MAYSELIKDFGRIRDYMREFFVYGFKSRDEYTKKSSRSYDDERRRLASWLGDYMQFRQNLDGKNVFISIDSRVSRHNPLYKAWKTKSFTDGDITLHFILFDILDTPETMLTLKEITERIDAYLQTFEEPRTFDESTVRKKLKEYISEGIIISEKQGRTVYYRRAESDPLPDTDILDYFSEVSACGAVGSFLLDKAGEHEDHFAFKHHYITGAMDSEIHLALLKAISERRSVTIVSAGKRRKWEKSFDVVPLQIRISVQNGRQYLMAYVPWFRRITSFRTDNISSVKSGEVREDFEEHRKDLSSMDAHMWGVSTRSQNGERMEHVEFTVRFGPDEEHILRRLEREKRCGTVERISEDTARFSADVYDASELIPWIRTFICRITSLNISNSELDERFKQDILDMYTLYGLEGGDAE